jgi:hypothetical protein
MSRRSIIHAQSGVSSVLEVPQPPEEIIAKRLPHCLNEENENESLDSSVSGLSQDEQEDEHDDGSIRCSRSPVKPRSIFGTYWKAGGEVSPSSRRTKIVVPPARAVSPMSVMAQSPWDAQDVMEMYGLERDFQKCGPDDFSINTYERTLKDCEDLPAPAHSCLSPYQNAPLWASWFSRSYHHSEPSLRMNLLRMDHGSMPPSRQVQSDSNLIIASPKASALRKGRFSTGSPSPKSSHVRFQARIQVHSYHPPVESWAAEGWSQWFGI